MPLLQLGLRYFEEVVRQGSLRKAEEQLHVAASAINRQILKLEEELGVPLFERLPRGLRLSPAGELLLYHVRRWQRDERQILEALGEISGVGCAEVRIATVESMTDQILPTVLGPFRERFPRIRFVIRTGVTDHILEQVITGDADIGICVNPPATRKIHVMEQVNLEFGAVMVPDHPLGGKPAVSLQECSQFATILQGDEMYRGSTLERALAQSGADFEPLAECNRILTIKSMARAGLGIAFMNRLDIARELERGELIFKPLRDWNIAKVRLVLCVFADRKLPIAIAVLLEELREALREVESRNAGVRNGN